MIKDDHQGREIYTEAATSCFIYYWCLVCVWSCTFGEADPTLTCWHPQKA